MSHLSFSQMTSYMRCSKAYQLSRLQHAPQTPAVWSFAGRALHETLNDIHNHHFTGDLPNIGVLWTKRFDEELTAQVEHTGVPPEQWKKAGRQTKDKPNREDVAWWRQDGLRQLQDYYAWLRNSGWTLLGDGDAPFSEIEVSGDFHGQHVKAFLDAVMVNPQGLMTVVDFKSGTRTPKSPIQLALYSVLLDQTMDLKVPYGSFMMTRKTEMTDPIDLSRWNAEWFEGQFSRLRFAVDQGIFMPNVGDACFTCDVSDSCYANGGFQAFRYDPDHPQYSQNLTDDLI